MPNPLKSGPNVASTHLALLRGINVGGKNMLPMKDLAAMFTTAGCADVRTYIQSGNILFAAPDQIIDTLSATISQQIAKSFGHSVPVILRTAAQLHDALTRNPFAETGADENSLHVFFLADAPSGEAIAALDPDRSPPDEFRVRDREIYVRLPNGMGRTKLTNAYFDAKLHTTSTARNWRTVRQLAALLTPAGPRNFPEIGGL